MSSITEKFGKRVRQLRVERGLSQESFSDLVGLDRSYLGGVERGKRNISILNINKISKALGITIKDLFTGVDE